MVILFAKKSNDHQDAITESLSLSFVDSFFIGSRFSIAWFVLSAMTSEKMSEF